MEIQGDSSLVQLPALTLQRIVCRVEARELAILCCTCRELNDICSEPWLWRTLCMKRWKHRQTDLWKEHWRASSFKTLYGAKDRVSQRLEVLNNAVHHITAFRILSKKLRYVGRQKHRGTCPGLKKHQGEACGLHTQAV